MTGRPPARAVGYTYEVFDRIADVDRDVLQTVWSRAGGTVFADPRFLRTVDETLRGVAQLWHAVVRNEFAEPVALASLCALPVPLGVLAPPRVKRVVEALDRLRVPVRPTILFCGLPVSAGQCHLLAVPQADPARVAAALDTLMVELARRHGIRLLCCKEFTGEDRQRFAGLADLGWVFAEVPAMNYFDPQQPELAAHLGALRSKKRLDIRRSMRKAERAGMRLTRLRDPEAIVNCYSAAVHELYVAVVRRSAHRLETLPVEFFHTLARAFAGQVELVVASLNGRVAAFNWSLTAGGVYHLLFCGIDYTLNPQVDAYYNVMYAELDRGMRLGAGQVQMGQTADAFKGRLGCYQRPRFVAVRGGSAALSRLLATTSRVLLEPPTAAGPVARS